MGWVIALGIATAGAGAFGCSKGENIGSNGDEVVSKKDAAEALKSVITLDGTCIAVKVGPKHLITSARCVAGSQTIASGKSVAYASAASGKKSSSSKGTTSTEDTSGSGSDAETEETKDTTTTPKGDGTVTIATVTAHPSFAAKCKEPTSCGFETVEASDSPDIAILTLSKELSAIPTTPVDLDPVGQNDPLIAVSSGCKTIGAKAGALKATGTVAVPARAVNHSGSPYAKQPQFSSRLGQSYVVSAGPAWQKTLGAYCTTDLGAPIMRGDTKSVAGLFSNYTSFDGDAMVTISHTRLDLSSRFRIGAWLEKAGVETIKSCSETEKGCPKRVYSGPMPSAPDAGSKPSDPPADTDAGTTPSDPPADTDAGTSTPTDPPTDPPAEADAGTEPTPEEDPTAPSDGEYAGDGSEDYGIGDNDDSSSSSSEKTSESSDKSGANASESGCSTAPGRVPAGSDVALGFGVVIALGAIRRRRDRGHG